MKPTIVAGAVYKPQAMRRFQDDYKVAIKPYIQRLQRIVMDAATTFKTVDGVQIRVIPPSSGPSVLQEAGDTIQRFFVGPDMRNPFGADGVTPLAPYPELLNKWLAWVTIKVIQKHADLLKKALPPDIRFWLASRLSREQYTPHTHAQKEQFRSNIQAARELFIQNPLVYYDAPHTWIDPRGYTLSRRIWDSSIEVRRKIDALLDEGIRTGRSAFDIAADLEQFLTPGAALKRTTKPYGRNASYHAMNLGRTEIAYAHSNATRAAGYANPLVDGWEWALSASHPKIDICDELATIGMAGERLRDPYPLDGAEPVVVKDSHPQCLCNNRTSISQNIDDIIAKLRDDMRNNRPAPVTPIDVYNFVRVLMGIYLARLGWDQVQREAIVIT